MTWLAAPERLGWLAVVVPLLLVWGMRSRGRRRRDWSALAQSGGPPGDDLAGWLAAAVCLVLALAQPRWGRAPVEALPPGHDVVIAVDVSRSMGCEDVVPDRLGRAIEAAGSLVRSAAAAPGDRAAVVAFAGRGVVRCPLTQSLGAVVDALHNLRPGTVAPGGTDLAAALDAAAEAFDDQDHDQGRTVVLLSDGEDHAGTWPAALERLRARDRNVVVHTVALGDPERGAVVPGSTPGEAPLTYQGSPVVSRRRDEALARIAAETGGAFLPLGLAEADLGALYRDRIAPVVASRRAGGLGHEPPERYALFVLAALGLTLSACRPRRRFPRVVSLVPVAALVVALGAGPTGGTAVALVESGRQSYAAGQFEAALAAFERAAALAPSDPVTRYNVAATLFQLGRHAEAILAYEAARPRAPEPLRTKIDYALGNSALAKGDATAALAHYDACLASTASDAESIEVRRRAAANRAFAAAQAQRAQTSQTTPDQAPNGNGEPKPREPDPTQASTPSPSPAAPAGGDNPAHAGPPGPGGAASPRTGAGRPSQPTGGTPREQLEQALEYVREARQQRLADPPPSEAPRDGKDW